MAGRIARRDVLTGIAAGAAGLALPGWQPGAAAAVGASGASPLRMPPMIDTGATGRLHLTAQTGTTAFAAGAAGRTAGFDGSYLGPVIRMHPGAVDTRIDNQLAEAITVHWHGLLVAGDVDGGPHAPVRPAASRRFEMPLAQAPMTAWYHSHIHGHTARHVYSGLAGVIHITDGQDDARGLPSRYGIDDLTLILQDRRFDAEGRMVYDLAPMDVLNGFHGNRMVVNGQAGAVAVVPQGWVRLRLLNASNARTYTLMLSDRRDMHLIATDAGYLPAPRDVVALRLASGERAEVMVDFSDGRPVRLISGRGNLSVIDIVPDARIPRRIDRLPQALAPDLPPLAGGVLPQRRFGLSTSGGVPSPAALASLPQTSDALRAEAVAAMIAAGWPEALAREVCTAPTAAAVGATGPADVADLRHLPHDFTINGRSYDPARIDFHIPLGQTERWVISGGAALEHPFHVHGVHFRVVSEGGATPRPENQGWKDTVLVSGAIEIEVRFDHPAPPQFPYMFHCHILEHEDAGMMGQFSVG